MKLIIYTLNEDGTIPDYVLDGGYWPCPNEKISPQDIDLIGVALDSAIESSFVNKEELIAYGESKGLAYTDSESNEFISVESLADYLWAKVEN